MDRIVHGVEKSGTRLSDFHFTFPSNNFANSQAVRVEASKMGTFVKKKQGRAAERRAGGGAPAPSVHLPESQVSRKVSRERSR